MELLKSLECAEKEVFGSRPIDGIQGERELCELNTKTKNDRELHSSHGDHFRDHFYVYASRPKFSDMVSQAASRMDQNASGYKTPA